MFNPSIMKQMLSRHGDSLSILGEVETLLRERFLNMEVQIRGLILAAASGEPMLFVGPPGTAKSRLVRAFCGLTGLMDEADPSRGLGGGYFEYLLTPFTEPAELFGYYDLAKAHHEHALERDDRGMMQNAEVVFIDEVFKGSSAILNSILAFMNERIFHDRGRRTKVKMQCMFSATNDIPQTSELRALFDRFLLRTRFYNIDSEPESVRNLIQKGWIETYSTPDKSAAFSSLLGKMEELRQDLRKATVDRLLRPEDDANFYGNLAHLVHASRQYAASAMSNRRLVKMTHVMLIHRLYRAALEKRAESFAFGMPEYQVFWDFFLDNDDPRIVEKMQKLPFGVNFE